MIWLAAIPAFWVLVILHACWASRRTRSLSTEPVPHWPSGGRDCTWCQVRPDGMCTCTSVCGHVNCVGDYTSMATLTAQDVRWLREQTIRGHE